MASSKRAQSGAPPLRKAKTNARAKTKSETKVRGKTAAEATTSQPTVPGKRVTPDPRQQALDERNPFQPLSFLPEARRAIAARTRVNEYILVLMNILLEARGHAEPGARERYLSILNIMQSLSIVARQKTITSEAARKAWGKLERVAIGLSSILEPDSPQIVPSLNYEKGGPKHSLTSIKVTLLDIASEALKGHVNLDDQMSDRLSFQQLDKELEREHLPDDDVTRRAEEVANTLGMALESSAMFDALLTRSAIPNNAPDNHARLTRAARYLIMQELATPVQLARATLYVFGNSPQKIKNAFTSELLEKHWKGPWVGRAKKLKAWREMDGLAWPEESSETAAEGGEVTSQGEGRAASLEQGEMESQEKWIEPGWLE
jgi:hypothetical protein